MIDEEELIRRFKDGASDAFDAIYASYYKPVYNYTYRLTKDKTLAEDLTQDSLIKVFANLKDADESRTLLPWIFRIAHNTCIDYYRKNRASFELMEDIACHDLRPIARSIFI